MTIGELSYLHPGAFNGLTRLSGLYLYENRFDAPPRGVFSPLTKLKEVWMGGSQLTTLPSGAFENPGELTLLHLYQNLLSELPDSLFTGLSELAQLNLEENPGTPFTLSVHLERTDTSELDAPGPATVVVALAEGAPFSMRIPLSVEGDTISTDTVVIEGGQITSAEFTVTPGFEQREHPGDRRPGAGGPGAVPRNRCRRGRHPQSVLVFG